jgi:hypothetical protein
LRLEQILEPVAAELVVVEERVSSRVAIDPSAVSEAIGFEERQRTGWSRREEPWTRRRS